MDGLPETLLPATGGFNGLAASYSPRQRTIKRSIGCVGIGLHCGRRVQMNLHPAPAGSGIVFRRIDVGSGLDIPARFDRVVDTRLCTGLAVAERPEVQVGTVEHLMAALLGSEIDNVLVELDGPEVPILDGSSAPFVFLLDCAGVVEQDASRREIEVLRPVRVEAGEAFAELRPSPSAGLAMAMSIAFDAPAIGRQALSLRLTASAFRHELARARTFTLMSEVARLQAGGRAKGGSLENAIVVDQARVLNPGGLRMSDEFVRHKLLDAVGDLALAGAAIHGRFIAHRSGHTLNNQLVRTLLTDARAWRVAPRCWSAEHKYPPATQTSQAVAGPADWDPSEDRSGTSIALAPPDRIGAFGLAAPAI